MGYDLKENFRRPYFATTITDFWRRWHISLSTWFRDYVYIPLGGNRVSTARCHLNTMITFIVSGLWHGANWTFVIWGTIHGTLQCMEKVLGWHRATWGGYRKALHWALTFCIVSLAWVFFRTNSIGEAFKVIRGIFADAGMPFLSVADNIGIAMALGMVFAKEVIEEYHMNIRVAESPHWLIRHMYIVCMLTVILLFGVLTGGQFIYFQF